MGRPLAEAAPRERSARSSERVRGTPLRGQTADRVLGAIGAAAASIVLVVVGALALSLVALAAPVAGRAGDVFGARWDPARGAIGAMPFVYGTVVTSGLGMLLAVPVALGVAVFLTDLGPLAMRRRVGVVVELLAAVPGVVYGLWAASVLAPLLRTTIEPALGDRLGALPLFRGPPRGVGLLSGSLVLAVMILPTITQVSREVLRAVPAELREGGLALGATRWDVVRLVVIPHARRGLLGAILLGFGRAAGEAMAVAAVIGGRPEISASLFAPGSTMASVLATELPDTSSPLHVAALAEIGLLLFLVTLAFNLGARLLVGRREAR